MNDIRRYLDILAEADKIDATNGAYTTSDDLNHWKRWSQEANKPGYTKSWTKGGYTFRFYPNGDKKPEGVGNIMVMNWSNDVVANLWIFHKGDAMKGAIQVHPRERRKGIASALYTLGEQITGEKFTPDTPHSPYAQAFWAKRPTLVSSKSSSTTRRDAAK